MEEGGDKEGDEAANAKDSLRDCWRKLVESEERLKFFKRMVGMDLEVQEIEHLGEDIRNKLGLSWAKLSPSWGCSKNTQSFE